MIENSNCSLAIFVRICSITIVFVATISLAKPAFSLYPLHVLRFTHHVLHRRNHCIRKFARLHLGRSLHQPREVAGDGLRVDRA
jgi:hypothetical protein